MDCPTGCCRHLGGAGLCRRLLNAGRGPFGRVGGRGPGGGFGPGGGLGLTCFVCCCCGCLAGRGCAGRCGFRTDIGLFFAAAPGSVRRGGARGGGTLPKASLVLGSREVRGYVGRLGTLPPAAALVPAGTCGAFDIGACTCKVGEVLLLHLTFRGPAGTGREGAACRIGRAT